ncbi:hypothetical protein SUGI_0558190 [Cryptomeria japonica]|nr:hypothetical protein SUGI_0558190 [Cryptomeria japonica]
MRELDTPRILRSDAKATPIPLMGFFNQPCQVMANNQIDIPPKGGFSFDLCKRNEMLIKKGIEEPKFRKTGTTIVGLVFKDGVILGADTRATEGPIVCDNNCEKIHYIAPNIYCCGAGTAADTEACWSCQYEYELSMQLVVSALTILKSHLFGYQGHVSAALVLGGVDITGTHLHTVYPHGSTDTLPFATMGFGSLAAMAMFESRYKEGLNVSSNVYLQLHLCAMQIVIHVMELLALASRPF